MSNTAPGSRGIRLIVGLGNVGAEYERTRHNAGFWFADRVAAHYGASFRAERKFSGRLARAAVGAREVWLLEPATYMNLSGQAVAAVASFYRIGADEILVAHDELDLAPGDVRLKLGGGVAGHNGLKDIRARLATAEFWRLRLGIGHPRSLGLQQPVADFVLHPPRREEAQAIDEAIERAGRIVELVTDGQFPLAMMRLHTVGRS